MSLISFQEIIDKYYKELQNVNVSEEHDKRCRICKSDIKFTKNHTHISPQEFDRVEMYHNDMFSIVRELQSYRNACICVKCAVIYHIKFGRFTSGETIYVLGKRIITFLPNDIQELTS